MNSEPITTGETGPDWEPTPATKYYAQRGPNGPFEFGPTEEAARLALKAREEKEAGFTISVRLRPLPAHEQEKRYAPAHVNTLLGRYDGPWTFEDLLGFMVRDVDTLCRTDMYRGGTAHVYIFDHKGRETVHYKVTATVTRGQRWEVAPW